MMHPVLDGLDAILDASPKTPQCWNTGSLYERSSLPSKKFPCIGALALVGRLVEASCLIINNFAVQAGMVAVETSIDVGNILWISTIALWVLRS